MNTNAQQFTTRFERTSGLESSPYEEGIQYFRDLDHEFATIDIRKAGPTDTRFPLHVVYYSQDGNFDVDQWHKQGKLIILVNNCIHPGEPDGLDASMMLLRDAATGKLPVPDNIVLAVVPVLNIGGALNRGSYSRANQNGPLEYGFRGNARNFDLNRDFIKLDAKETQSFVHLFHELDPDLFIDNHVSNGADYQHVMTLLSPQPDKLGKVLGQYLANQLEPAIYASMKDKGYDLVPYVNHWGETPDKGWPQFNDPPRFTSGFAALFQTIPFVPETHMLKSYRQRVESTYALMQSFIEYAGKHSEEIQAARQQERQHIKDVTELPIDWTTDTAAHAMIEFKGYAAAHKPSEVSGLPRLYYDRDKPYTMQVPFYNKFHPTITATLPQAYIIPQAWAPVTDRLRMNGVLMTRLEEDTVMELTVYRISHYESGAHPYEGHYLHTHIKYTAQKEQVALHAGDFVIPTDQKAKRYLAETLQPDAPDAFMAWGFFDAILQQKEYFSDYVFEDEAAALLKKDPALKKQLEEKKKADPAFAKDGAAQLDFIYRHSPYYEKTHLRYPVFRME